jgi:hypothetical protein
LVFGRSAKERQRVNIDWDSLYLAYDWAKEWQVLLAGLLVLLAALIIAWATIRAAKMGSAPRPESKARSDLRREPAPASSPPPSGPSVSTATSGELVSSLEQLRSLIRSALSSLPATDDQENNPANFLCQRILHLRLDQLPPPAHAGKAAQEGLSTLQKQLGTLRTQLKKDASPAELSEILVQINSSARSLVAALGPASEKRRQAGQDTR